MSSISLEFPENGHSEVVFLTSPTVRSGTTFLRQLILEGGICGQAAGWPYKWEDWILHDSNHLVDYCNSLENHWTHLSPPEPHSAKNAAKEIRLLIGRTLTRRMAGGSKEKYVLVKTPSSKNVENFELLFPAGKLIILIRDGRDTCHSNVRSGFSNEHAEAFNHWSETVKALLAFDSDVDFASTSGKHLWIKYEDCVADPVSSLTRITEFLGIPSVDPAKLDRLVKLPIYGSSEARDDNDGFVYKTEPRSEGFNPIGRWRTWSEDRINEFKKIAGQQLIQLGYEKTNDW